MKQYNKLHRSEYYHWQEVYLVEQIAPIWQFLPYAERVHVKIDPAIIDGIMFDLNDLTTDEGYNEVVCEGNGVTVFITLWFTEQGYHAIIWDKEE